MVGDVRRAEPIQRPGAPHTLHRGVQPQGQEEFRVGGRAAGLAVDRGDDLVERGQVQLLDVGPHAPGPVVFGEEALQVDGPQADLGAIGLTEPGRTGSRLQGRLRCTRFTSWEPRHRVSSTGGLFHRSSHAPAAGSMDM